MKLSTKFLIPTVLLISIGMGMLTLISFVYSKNAIEESVAAQMEQLLNSTIDNYANWVEARRADLDTWSQQEACIAALEQSFIGISARKSFTQDLIKLKARHDYYHDIFLVDLNGTVITASMPEKIGKHNIVDADSFVRALEGDLAISPVYRDIISGKPVFVMAMPVLINGLIKGQLLMEFDLAALNRKFIDKIKIGRSGQAFIVDNRDGRILAHPDPSTILKANIVNDSLVREIFNNEKGDLQIASPLGAGQGEQLVVYDVLKELNWKIAIVADIEELSAPIIKIKNINFIITITMICVASLIIILLTKTTIIRPIQRLQASAEQLSLGSLDHPIDIERADELGSLARSFAVMRDSIKLQMGELQRAEAAAKKSLREKEVLVREIHHRAKNNMQVISSLLSLQLHKISDTKYREIFHDSCNRIRSMSLVHENLYQSSDLASINLINYINSLASNLFKTYNVFPGKVSLKTDIKDITLGIDAAIPCGLIINELFSNSLKHAFPADRKGEIHISFKQVVDGDGPAYVLIVKDNGIGIPDDFDLEKVDSMGLHLVMTLAKNQLLGEVTLDRTEGTEFRIKFREPMYKKRV